MTTVVQETGEFTTQDHWRFLGEFVREEKALGGPDPHLATLGPMLRDCDLEEKVWRCLLYASGYNIPLAEAIWQTWPYPKAVRERGRSSLLADWVHVNWPKFTLRRERRAVRTPEKFSRMLESMLSWSLERETLEMVQWGTDFELAWRSTSRIYGLGRYVQQKLIEALCRHVGAQFNQDDIRAKDGHSPREGLALLFPYSEATLTRGGNSPEILAIVDDVADRVKLYLDNSKTPVSYFELQVVLCEYKKSWQGKQYPGRTHDTELRYWRDARSKWGDFGEAMLAARAEVFPRYVLGEENGWWRQREELEAALPVYRYTWSDRLYDYWASTVENPMPR